MRKEGYEVYEVSLTSVGAKMAREASLNGGEPYTTRIIDNMPSLVSRMADERTTDHAPFYPVDSGNEL